MNLMIEEKIKEELRKSLNAFKESDNPRLYELIKKVVIDGWNCYEDPFSFAVALDTADMTCPMPEAVGDIVIDLYTVASENQINKGTALNNLGVIFYNDRYGRKDQSKAIEYYNEAAKNGDEAAFANLGYCYYYGSGTQIDYEKAYYYFSKAALKGSAEAMYKLGDMFKCGHYVDKDEDLARTAYVKAISLLEDNSYFIPCTGKAYLRIGDMYYEGIGTEIDLNFALEAYQKAEAAFYEMLRLGDIYSDSSMKHVKNRIAEIMLKKDEYIPQIDWTKKF
ncbi:tetratricopeptide repeat protein [Butyrivibrio sp. INlla18]|uniref:tetratricopeptide repeat protein n=1 Tax=Butyrivibrio sp. INlla18 TaxID=1520806 RepID=UPI000B84467A|nr:tetratricopeptide repeat protein [Butyrivibrio sp. INlla18]